MSGTRTVCAAQKWVFFSCPASWTFVRMAGHRHRHRYFLGTWARVWLGKQAYKLSYNLFSSGCWLLRYLNESSWFPDKSSDMWQLVVILSGRLTLDFRVLDFPQPQSFHAYLLRTSRVLQRQKGEELWLVWRQLDIVVTSWRRKNNRMCGWSFLRISCWVLNFRALENSKERN